MNQLKVCFVVVSTIMENISKNKEKMNALYAVLSPLKEGENGNKQGQIPTPQCHINKSIR